jgi:hypothetical protein
VRAVQWFFRAHEHGDFRAAEFRGVKSIARGLLNGDVSSDSSNRQNAHIRRPKRHDQGYGVIGSRVCINQEKRFHAA